MQAETGKTFKKGVCPSGRQGQPCYKLPFMKASFREEGNKDKNEVALRIYKGESKAHEER